MAWTSSIYAHFIIWPSSMTLTFNLPEQIFQMALLLLKKKNYAKLFWKPCINIAVIDRTSSIYDHFIIWPSRVTLTFNPPEQMFQMALLLLKENNCATLFWIPCINVSVMARTSSIYVTFKCDLDLQPNWKNVSNGTSPPQGQQLCQIIIKSMYECRSYGPDKSGCTHTLTHTHIPNKNRYSLVSLYRKWAWHISSIFNVISRGKIKQPVMWVKLVPLWERTIPPV